MQETYNSRVVTAKPPDLFLSFWQAGFECSTHRLPSGRRLDIAAATKHDVFAAADYARLNEAGIATVREGLRWHLIETGPGRYDFSSALRLIDAAERNSVQIIWDLLHFGWPDHWDIQLPDWGCHFAAFAYAFGKELARSAHSPVFAAPINEMSFLAWAGGECGFMNPHCTGRGLQLKKLLVKAAIGAAGALRASLPVHLVWPEPVIQVHADSPADWLETSRHNAAMYEAWDMIAGRTFPELGGHPSYLEVLGVNYYPHNQRWNSGVLIPRTDPRYRPFADLLVEVSERYGCPLFISETGAEDDDRAPWLAYIGNEARAAQRRGVDLQGICLYPILNHPGWDDDRHCQNGLWDYADTNGHRSVHLDLAQELFRQQSMQKEYHDHLSRSHLPFSSSLEFRVSTPAALDEPLCA